MAKKIDAPEVVDLTPEELDALFNRLDQTDLDEKDKKILKGSIRSCLWTRQALETGKLTIYKLKRFFLGFRSEKSKKKSQPEAPEEASPDEEVDSQENVQESAGETALKASLESDTKKKTFKGHGRLGVDSYPEAERVVVPHTTLKAGNACPKACGGKLYQINPGIFIRVVGQNLAKALKYEVEKLRCATCGIIATADLPPGVSLKKYDFRFKAILAVQKYFCGVPFYRQEHFQELLRFRLPDATQWDLIEQLANGVYPIIGALEDVAAAGEVIHNDDTGVKIVEIICANARDPTRKRRGMFTTAIFARVDPYKVGLYYSGTEHAGENLARILKKRPKDLPLIIHMCDALAANLTSEFLSLLARCMAHGRRQFTDIEIFFPEDCGYVIEQLGKVYLHDKQAKDQELSDETRLAYHQEHSAPVMDELKKWLDEQIKKELVEPNGGLGKAIAYMRRHWNELTLFLRVPKVPLDNNVVERAIKLAIRLRKNSMIHRTCHGAHIAGIFLSLIQTCRLNGVNPVEYLTVLQENKSAIFKKPSEWLPWNYEETLKQRLMDLSVDLKFAA